MSFLLGMMLNFVFAMCTMTVGLAALFATLYINRRWLLYRIKRTGCCWHNGQNRQVVAVTKLGVVLAEEGETMSQTIVIFDNVRPPKRKPCL